VLSTAALVGRLRGAVCAPDGVNDDSVRACAATQLARLANAGVPGADPAGWHGLIPLSTSDPLCDAGDLVTLTPSTLQTLNDCPLRWFLGHEVHADSACSTALGFGSIVHALAHEVARSADPPGSPPHCST